jgi:ribosomal protein S18 acetylase RimI-like enzyme
VEAIADVLLDARREAMPWLSVLHSREDAIAYFSGHVLLHQEVFVAEVKRLVAGFMALEGDHVDHIYVAPAFRVGIGNKLCSIGQSIARRGLRAVDLYAQCSRSQILRSARF